MTPRMKWRIHLACFILFSCFCFVSTWAQASIFTPTINLRPLLLPASQNDLAWNSPATAASCLIIYTANGATTQHPIANFALNQGSIPRRNPPGITEKFKIVFIDQNSDSLYHELWVLNTYGGIVVIEEEIFAPLVIGTLDTLDPNLNLYFNIQPGCFIVSSNLMAMATDSSLAAQGITSSNPDTILSQLDTMVYHDDMLSRINVYANTYAMNTDSVVIDNSISSPLVFPEKPQAQVDSGLNRADCSVGPSPFGHQFNIFIPSQYQHKELRISARSMEGKMIYTQQVEVGEQTRITTPTDEWPPGMYHISIVIEGQYRYFNLIKY